MERCDCNECCICLDLINENGISHSTLECSHTFHTLCLLKWCCNKTTSCPICRHKISKMKTKSMELYLFLFHPTESLELYQYKLKVAIRKRSEEQSINQNQEHIIIVMPEDNFSSQSVCIQVCKFIFIMFIVISCCVWLYIHVY
jgi:hypothetical protein